MIQGKFVACTRLFTTGPATPNDAALTWAEYSFRKSLAISSRPLCARLEYRLNATCFSLPLATSYKPRLDLVPPKSPAKIIDSSGTGL